MHAPTLEFDELVVDTSVILKALIPETDSDKAEALCRSFLLGKIRLLTLDFFLVEAVNALWVKTRRRELVGSEAEEKIEILTGVMQHMRSTRRSWLSRTLAAFRSLRRTRSSGERQGGTAPCCC